MSTILRARDRLLQDVLSSLPAVEQPFVLRMLARAASEFARASTAWRETVEDDTGPLGDRLSVVPSEGMVEFVAAVRSRDNGQPLRDWLYQDGEVVFLRPQPMVPVLIEMVISPEPGLKGEDIPDEFLAQHYHALLEGTLAYLYEQPAKPWTSLTLHQTHRRRFVRYCHSNRHRVTTGRNPNPRRPIPGFGAQA